MYGIFNDESADWTEEEAVEGGFYTKADAEEAAAIRYPDDDDLTVHEIEDAPEPDHECENCGEEECECIHEDE